MLLPAVRRYTGVPYQPVAQVQAGNIRDKLSQAGAEVKCGPGRGGPHGVIFASMLFSRSPTFLNVNNSF